jgi:hypothetical protein
LRNCNRFLRLILSESSDLAKRVDAGHEADFRFKNIADAGDDFLVQQDVGNLLIGMRKHATLDFSGIEILAQDVDGGPRNAQCAGEFAGPQHLRHRNAKAYCKVVAVFKHDAHVHAHRA